MARINIEDEYRQDPRRDELKYLVAMMPAETRARLVNFIVDGAMMNAWMLAEKYWCPPKREGSGRAMQLIPRAAWEGVKLPKEILEADLAVRSRDGKLRWETLEDGTKQVVVVNPAPADDKTAGWIYVRGTDSKFGWRFKKKEDGHEFGKKSAAGGLKGPDGRWLPRGGDAGNGAPQLAIVPKPVQGDLGESQGHLGSDQGSTDGIQGGEEASQGSPSSGQAEPRPAKPLVPSQNSAAPTLQSSAPVPSSSSVARKVENSESDVDKSAEACGTTETQRDGPGDNSGSPRSAEDLLQRMEEIKNQANGRKLSPEQISELMEISAQRNRLLARGGE